MKMKSVMQHSFAQVPQATIPRSSFDRSRGYKTTFNAGDLIPIFVDEALPGDTYNVRASLFARLNTPIVPVMDNLFLETFFFAVPNRLVWDNWQKFNGEQTNPGDSTDFLVPQIAALASVTGSIADYFGIPIAGLLNVNSMPFRAYNLIWNEWFRDQNLQSSVSVPTGDGPDLLGTYSILKRGKRHDYFTSALPWPQKGTAVTIPLGTEAPIKGKNASGVTDQYVRFASGDVVGSASSVMQAVAGTPGHYTTAAATAGGFDARWPVTGNTTVGYNFADLSAATSATINSLRQAFQIQKLYERDARGGTRYTEIIRSHFGVTSPDARLQRPEYLGGGSTNITIHPIAQTSSTDAVTPQGNLSAMGTASATGHGFVKSFTEHSYIIGLANVRADLNYQQGLNKMWTRRTRWDFYWPALCSIGEQAVLNKEIYAAHATPDGVFGYQERYAEYRYAPSIVTGLFRSGAAGTIDIWHLAQNFSSAPALNSTFIQDAPPISRVVALPSQPNFKLDVHFGVRCARPMPTYGVPGQIDRF